VGFAARGAHAQAMREHRLSDARALRATSRRPPARARGPGDGWPAALAPEPCCSPRSCPTRRRRRSTSRPSSGPAR
jgi:hypothetical protein